MEAQELIVLEIYCELNQIEVSFVESLEEFELIAIVKQNNQKYLINEQLATIDKIIRLHNQLNINREGIQVAFNLLQKMEQMDEEIRLLKAKLSLYE